MKENEAVTTKTVKKKLIIRGLIVAGIIIFCLLIIICACNSHEKNTEAVEKAKSEAIKIFNDSQKQKYLDALRADTGLTDLEMDYQLNNDYDKNTKELMVTCEVEKFTSKEIDEYYTDQLNDEKAKHLNRIFDCIDQDGNKSLDRYTSDDGIRIYLRFSVNNNEIKSSDHSYTLSPQECVFVDGTLVFQEEDSTEAATETTTPSTQATQADNSSSNGLGKKLRDGDTKTNAWICAQDVAKGSLKSPSTAKFCSIMDVDVYDQGNNNYAIIGYVDAENSYGAKMRTNFTVWLTLTKSGYKNGYVVFDE